MAKEKTKRERPGPGTIGARLLALRSARKWTLEVASAATGGKLSPSRINNYEWEERSVGIPEAKILATAYDTSAAHILHLDDDNPVLGPLEKKCIRDLRAMPENERNSYMRRIETFALAYKDPAPDERLSPAMQAGAPKVKPQERKKRAKS